MPKGSHPTATAAKPQLAAVTTCPAITAIPKPAETVETRLPAEAYQLAVRGAALDGAPGPEEWIARAIAFSLAMSCQTIEEAATAAMNRGAWRSEAIPHPSCFV